MNKESSEKLRVLSFIFTIAIVGYHSNIIIGDLYTSSVLNTITANTWELLANVAMSFFFMTSGFLLYNCATEKSIYEKLVRRIRTVVIPFIIWNSIYFAFSILQNGLRGSVWHLLYRFSFDPYDGSLWYLFAITLLSVFSPAAIKLKEKKWFDASIIIICIMSVIIYGFHVFTKSSDLHIVSWVERLLRYLPSYVVGACSGIKKNLNIHIHKRNVIAPMVIALSVLWALAGRYLPDVLKMIDLFLCPIVIWEFTPQVLRTRSWMKNSFIIYAIHRMIITGQTIIGNKLNIGGLHNSLLRNGICVLFPFINCLLIWLFVDLCVKIMRMFGFKRILNLLSGGRK